MTILVVTNTVEEARRVMRTISASHKLKRKVHDHFVTEDGHMTIATSATSVDVRTRGLYIDILMNFSSAPLRLVHGSLFVDLKPVDDNPDVMIFT